MNDSSSHSSTPARPSAGTAAQITGNHFLAFPEIRPEDGAIGSINVLHRGLSGLVSWAGSETPASAPFLQIRVRSGGTLLDPETLDWERLERWIPRWSARFEGGLRVRVTICAPGGFDPLVRGAVVHAEVENGPRERDLAIEFHGAWGATLLTVATTRLLHAGRDPVMHEGGVTLEAGGPGRGVALALRAVGGRPGTVSAEAGTDAPPGPVHRFRLTRDLALGGGARGAVSLILAVAPERDGALATALRLEGEGAADLIRKARLDLAQLGRATEDAQARDLVARNLPFHHYYAAARAIDDDRIYPVMSRSPAHGACAVFGEREALAWSLPAYCLTDPGIAREILMRCLEVHSDRPGFFRRYLDGGILDPGFSLGRACEWGLALLRYLDLTRDETILVEPLVQQVLRELDDLLYRRLHRDVFLGSTEVLPGGDRADFPYSAFDNVLLWSFCRALARLWRPEPDEPPARLAGGDEEIEAAFWRHCVTDFRGVRVIAGSADLEGKAAIYDDPAGTLALLPQLGFCPPDDPIYTDTMELLRSSSYPLWLGGREHPGLAARGRGGSASLAALCADLLSPDRKAAIMRIRRLRLPGDVACSTFDPDGGGIGAGPYAASEAGLLVWTLLQEPERADRRSR